MKIISILLFLLCSQIAIAAEITDSKKRVIDELLVLTGLYGHEAGKMISESLSETIVASHKLARPDIDPGVLDIIFGIVEEEVGALFTESNVVSELMYPIYGSRFSEAELRELVAFYNTPLGVKLNREMPAITQARKEAGKSIIPEIQQRIATRFKNEGLKLNVEVNMK